MIEFLAPENREEALVVSAAVALHALITARTQREDYIHEQLVSEAFALAQEFLKQAQMVQS
jgi:hypothetical protein